MGLPTNRNIEMKTDSQLKTDVNEELKWEPSINAAQIGVEVNEGIVTLAGHVDSYMEKWNAEKAAQRVSGVKAVTVDMTVKLPGWNQRDDTDIARSAENAIKWTAGVPEGRVKILVEKGWVTLTGEVDWEYQRMMAKAAVRALSGVTGVSNRIEIKIVASSAAVKSDIEAALRRRATVDSKQIQVKVEGSDVTLTGHVPNWFERDLAVQSAWRAAGVRNVVDNMSISY